MDNVEQLYVIWDRPYEAPQEALGYFTLAEAGELLRKPDAEIAWHVEHDGFYETDRYRCEEA